jgi:enoyl-[acyl-carrier-protein] reductase (NADH)
MLQLQFVWVLLLNCSKLAPQSFLLMRHRLLIENLVDQAVAILGGKIDFVLHSIGMSVNVRKGNHYTNQNYEYTEKGWNVSAVS